MNRAAGARFCDALRHAAARLGRSTAYQVLLIGPGTTDPIDCISSILNPSRLFVIEIDSIAAASLKAQWASPDIHIVANDASDLVTFAPGLYHLVIVRHPDIERFRERWTMVFAAAMGQLISGGLVILSAYSQAEVSELQAGFSRLGMSIDYMPELTNEPVDLQGNDRYILLGQTK